MESRKLLVICYSFPPSPGIGGRRWAKFANYMHRSGVDVQVLAAAYEGNATSDWLKDTEGLIKEDRVHFFNTGYPSIIQKIPETIFQKLRYHITLAYLKKKIPGSFYDRSSLCKPYLLEEVKKFILKGYKDIIISVGPFMYARHLLAIKEHFPDTRLYLDVRDPWTNNKTAFGYNLLTPERFRHEKEAEQAVAKGFDKIITVADDIGAYFVNEYGISVEKVATVKNGFDPADFSYSPTVPDSKKILLFTGNLYEKAEKSFLMLVNELKKMKVSNPVFFDSYECHFYGEMHPSFAVYFSPDLNLYFKGKIPLKDVFIKISQSSACLLFLTDDLNFSFSTKFYEYLSQKKPIIVFSTPGKTGEFVESNNIGALADGGNLTEIISRIEEDAFYKKGFDISEFEVSNLTSNLLNIIADTTV